MSAPAFELPPALEAAEPPEARGLARDAVRLMVAARAGGRLEHARFHELPDLARARRPARRQRLGDAARRRSSARAPRTAPPVRVHFSTRAPGLDDRWRVVELRSADGARPARGRAGETTRARRRRADARARRAVRVGRAPAARPRSHGASSRCERATCSATASRSATATSSASWPLDGLPDRLRHDARAAPRCRAPAGRSRAELITRAGRPAGCRSRRSRCTPGVSSPERHEPPFPEQLRGSGVDRPARQRRRGAWGGRVIAVGTTVVRALETVAAAGRRGRARAGWTAS